MTGHCSTLFSPLCQACWSIFSLWRQMKRSKSTCWCFTSLSHMEYYYRVTWQSSQIQGTVRMKMFFTVYHNLPSNTIVLRISTCTNIHPSLELKKFYFIMTSYWKFRSYKVPFDLEFCEWKKKIHTIRSTNHWSKVILEFSGQIFFHIQSR